MVTIEQIEKGLARYLDTEIMPNLPQQGFERVLIGAGIALAIKRQKSRIPELRENEFVKLTGIFDEDGNVDLDSVRDEVKRAMPEKGVKLELPKIGVMKFKSADVDRLADFIQES